MLDRSETSFLIALCYVLLYIVKSNTYTIDDCGFIRYSPVWYDSSYYQSFIVFFVIFIYKWMKPIYKGWANLICVWKFVVLCSIHLWYATTGAISGTGHKFRRSDAYFFIYVSRYWKAELALAPQMCLKGLSSKLKVQICFYGLLILECGCCSGNVDCSVFYTIGQKDPLK